MWLFEAAHCLCKGILLGVGKVNCIVYMPPLDMLNAVYTLVCIVYGVYAPLSNIVCCIPIFSCVYSDFTINIVTLGLGKVLKQLWRSIVGQPSDGNVCSSLLCHLSQLPHSWDHSTLPYPSISRLMCIHI